MAKVEFLVNFKVRQMAKVEFLLKFYFAPNGKSRIFKVRQMAKVEFLVEFLKCAKWQK